MKHFSFKKVSISEIKKGLRELNSDKASTFCNIPNILKQNRKSCSYTLQKLTNDALKQGNFPDKLKSADVMPILKKDDPTRVKCYRSVSVLPGVSKTFERLMDKQWVFSNCSLTCVPSLLSLIEKLEKVLDNKEYGG